MEDTQKATLEMYSRVSDKMKRKISGASKATREGFTSVKLRARWYNLNQFDDNGETKTITAFENRLALRLVPLEAFDTPLAKLSALDSNKNATLTKIIEAYTSVEFPNPILKDLALENTLLRKMLTHPILKHSSAS